MVLWGTIWGGVLGLLWRGYGWEFNAVAGALLGALAGLTLRAAVRKELARQAQSVPAVARTVPAVAPAITPQSTPTAAPTIVAQPVAAAAATTAPAATPARPAVPVAKVPAAPARPDLVTALFLHARDWLLGGNTVVRVGVVVLFIGLAFLARYAVEHALLPPELRLAGIGIAGIALFAFGVRMRKRHPDRLPYSLTLQGAGVAVLYLTVFAAFRLYQFLLPGAAFGFLALICLFSAAIALAQNALPLAFIGFAGGFAAPVLVSTGQGSHVALFGYYLLLGVAIAVIAWLRAWRPLNLLGFFATFGVATAWGVLRYRPEHYASTQPFLIAFFLAYLLAALFYALRHGHGARKAVDATLLFGTPLAAFGLQAGLVRDIPYATAFSSLALGAVYVLLAGWMVRWRRGDAEVRRWLAECFLALALGFLTLAVPLALDGRWTAAVWAVEGAGVYWMGRRQGRWLARAFGIALQGLAAMLFLDGPARSAGDWPVANPAFLGAAMLAGAGLAIAWWSRNAPPVEQAGPMARAFASVEKGLSPVLFWIGFLWAQAALGVEIERRVVDAQGSFVALVPRAQQHLLHMAGWVLAAFALHRLALPGRREPWPIAATPAWFNLPVMLWIALWGMAGQDHVFQGVGWIAWPVALALHLVMLRRLDAGAPAAWWPWVHAGGVWLLVLLVGNLLVFAIGRAQLWRTAWATVILLVAASAVLLALVLACRHVLQPRPGAARWPLDRFAAAYAWRAAAPVAAGLALGALVVGLYSRGEARPLPYVPVLNPTDLAVGLALAVCALWLVRLRRSGFTLPAAVRGKAPVGVLAAVAFVAVNTVWLRVAHHYGGVAWDADDLFASFLVQAGYSILWTLIALVLMVGAHRRALRTPWMLGAALLGLTVLKLFVIDLSNRGGSERIVVFIAVGLLMLVVGWFAPLPPVRPAKAAPTEGELQGVAP